VSQHKTTKVHLVPDQVNAAIVDTLNNQRIRDEAMKLAAQDVAFSKAIEQIDKIREFIANPDAILGRMNTKHGEIAEQVEVGIRNAKAALYQQNMTATFEGVGRTAPEDYLIDGIAVQSKFINGVNNNLNHVLDHMKEYRDFGRDGSFYHIPKDTYETVIKIKNGLSIDEFNDKSIRAVSDKIQEIERLTGQPFDQVVKPGLSNYADVQIGKVDVTLDKHEQELKQQNTELKDSIKDDHKPSLAGATQAAFVAGAVGGTISLGTALYSKYKQGKNPFKGEFSSEDWKEVGFTTAKGAGGGAIAGGAIYLLTNNAALPAPFAGAIVSAAKGVSSLMSEYKAGKITFEEFTDLGLMICSESAIVGLATAAGQTLIPIPILGAVIGSLAGKILAEFATGKGQDVAQRMRKDMTDYISRIDANYQAIIKSIDRAFDRLGKLTEAAFDLKRNTDLLFTSANLARAYGVPEKNIITSHSELDSFMFS
jgi:hypothetical protein